MELESENGDNSEGRTEQTTLLFLGKNTLFDLYRDETEN